MKLFKKLKNYKAKISIRRFFNNQNNYFKTGDFIIDFMEGNRKIIKYVMELTQPFDVMLYSFLEKLFYDDFRNNLIEIIQLLQKEIINFTWEKKEQILNENPEIKNAFRYFQQNSSQKIIMDILKKLMEKGGLQ